MKKEWAEATLATIKASIRRADQDKRRRDFWLSRLRALENPQCK